MTTLAPGAGTRSRTSVRHIQPSVSIGSRGTSGEFSPPHAAEPEVAARPCRAELQAEAHRARRTHFLRSCWALAGLFGAFVGSVAVVGLAR